MRGGGVSSSTAANGGVKISGFTWRLSKNGWKSAFYSLLRPTSACRIFSGGSEEHPENPENAGKKTFSSDTLRFA